MSSVGLLAWMWAVAPAEAADGGTPPASADQDFRSYLDQARFFLRKEWYGDAREQLELAVATADGKLDPEAWYLLANVRYELGDLKGAHDAADRALVHSRDQDQARQTRELLTFFEEKFGYVTVVAPYDGVTARLSVELQSTLFDPNLKNWLAKLVGGLKDPVPLPYVLGLPAAKYTINGIEVDVPAGQTVSIAPKVGGNAPTLQSVSAELAVGAHGYSGATVGNLGPAPAIDLSLGIPLSFLALGITGGWALQPYDVRDDTGEVAGRLRSPFGWSVGARAGVDIAGPGPLVFRPSATWRVGVVPGVEVGCSSGTAQWTCDLDVVDRELYVYTSAVANAVGFEFAALYRDLDRGPVGFGIKGSGELVLGAVPKGGVAESTEGGPIDFVVPFGRGVSGGRWRLLALTSWSF